MTPVAVVGAGPVGLAAALLLARWDLPVVVLEAAPGRDPAGSRSICVQRDVLDVYHRVGVAEAIVAEGVTWRVGRTYAGDRELYTTTFPPDPAGAWPPFVNIPQYRVEALLEAAVKVDPRITLRYGTPVAGVDADGVRLAGGERVRASHVIAADGGRSAVRTALGIPFDGESFDDRFLICDIRADLPFGAERRFYFDPVWNPGRQVLVHPQPDSVWRIDWQVPPDFDLDAERAAGRLDARITAITGAVPYDVVWASVYRFHQRSATRFAIGNVLLAGDAAHLMAPFGARGLNSGVQDVENAAWKIAYERRGWAGPGLLASYDTERRAAAAENLRVTGATMRFLVPPDDAARAARRSALERSAVDPSEVDSGKLAEPYWYTESPLTTGPEPVGFPTAPGAVRPPVAGVLCPDAPYGDGRLRERFGLGATVAWVDERPVVDDPSVAEVLRVGPDVGGWARAGRCVVIRPDGHLAAVLDRPDPSELDAALRRARGVTAG